MYFSTNFAALLTISSTLVTVQGVPMDDKSSNGEKCPSNQFYYQGRDCCLPNGGPAKYYPVPKGKQCPNHYYWDYEKECCVPKYEEYDVPKCPERFIWTEVYCEQHLGDKSNGKNKYADKKYDGKKDKNDGKYDNKYDNKDGDKNSDKYGDKFENKDGDDRKWNGLN